MNLIVPNLTPQSQKEPQLQEISADINVTKAPNIFTGMVLVAIPVISLCKLIPTKISLCVNFLVPQQLIFFIGMELAVIPAIFPWQLEPYLLEISVTFPVQ